MRSITGKSNLPRPLSIPARKERVYVSGAITGLPYEEAERLFREASEYLEEQGYEAVNPMKEVPYNKLYNWFDYMADDIRLLGTCQSIYMLSNWESSDGAQVEHDIAVRKSLRVYHQ